MVILHPNEGFRATTFERVKEAEETERELPRQSPLPSYNGFHCLLTLVDGVPMYI
jgi:hypothetical protein